MAGVRSSKTISGVTYEFTTLSGKLMRQTWSGNEIQIVYDAYSRPYLLLYTPANGATQTYYYVLNVQSDVVGLMDSNLNVVVRYSYDPYGKPTGTTASSSYAALAAANPLRYRSYYYDAETGFYYLQSRYYDPAICRFINADSYLTTDITGMLSYNMFAYCEDNPIMYSDPDGEFFDTIFDVISLCVSVAEVIANPADPWAWASLAGDLVDVAVPFVSGVGETAKIAGVSVKASKNGADVIHAAKRVKNVAEKSNDFKKATGTYEILYTSGKNYVGKGGFNRAIDSAERYTKSNFLNGYAGDTVERIIWIPAANTEAAFKNEYLLQLKNGVNNNNTYNLIWSPGRSYTK